MKMEHYLAHTDYPVWEVIQKGNGPVKITTDTNGIMKLEIHGAGVSTEDANQKFLRALPSLWSQISLVMRTKQGVHSLSFDDLYNNLRVFESDVKGSTTSSSSSQNVPFVSSECTNSTNDISTAYVGSTASGNNLQKEIPSSCSLLANQSSCPQLDHEDLEQLNEFDLEEIDLKWQVAMISMRLKKFYKKSKGNQDNKRRDVWNSGYKAKDNGRRSGKQEEPNALVTLDGKETEVTSCSKECVKSYIKLKKLYDEQREQLGDASIEIQAYTQALKKVEAQLVAYQQNQLWYEEKIKFMKVDLDDKTDVLTNHKKLLAEALKEKDELKPNHIYGSILSYENEVLQSMFMNKESDVENKPLYDLFVSAEGMHAVPPPMTGNYMPSGPDIEIDYSKFTYDSSNSTPKVVSERMPKPDVIEPKVVSQPKVWTNAPIIEEYESDSDEDYVSTPLKE
ncbi:hypothetical protein Tco_0481375 [Tanacetum coccineum]